MTLLDQPPVEVAPLDSVRRTGQPRRKLGGAQRVSAFNLVGAAAAGVCTSLLLEQLTALSGPFGLVLVAYLAFLFAYAMLVWLADDKQAVVDAVMTVLMASTAVVAFGALALVIVYTLGRGWAALVHLNFYTQDMSTAGPLAPLTKGGMAHALVGTLWMVGIAVVLTVPLGLVAAVYLDMTRSHPARLFRTVVEAMTALPSILAGLFIYASWILAFGFRALRTGRGVRPQRDDAALHHQGGRPCPPTGPRQPPRGVGRARGPGLEG